MTTKLYIKIAHYIATLGYCGYITYAPGTVASMITVVSLYILPDFSWQITIMFAIILFVLSVWSSRLTSFFLNHKDPSCIVIDEVFGMYVATMFLPKTSVLYFCAFFLFRLFDITKPYPINALEKIDYRGLNIVIDDGFAGLLTLGLIFLSMFIFSF